MSGLYSFHAWTPVPIAPYIDTSTPQKQKQSPKTRTGMASRFFSRNDDDAVLPLLLLLPLDDSCIRIDVNVVWWCQLRGGVLWRGKRKEKPCTAPTMQEIHNQQSDTHNTHRGGRVADGTGVVADDEGPLRLELWPVCLHGFGVLVEVDGWSVREVLGQAATRTRPTHRPTDPPSNQPTNQQATQHTYTYTCTHIPPSLPLRQRRVLRLHCHELRHERGVRPFRAQRLLVQKGDDAHPPLQQREGVGVVL